MNKLTAIASIGTLALLGACASNTTPPPATTPDGLELVSSDKHSAVYIKPEAELQIYEKFGIVPCKVAFRKNWQRDYNSAHRSATQQVKQRDIDRIKTDLGAECTTFFTNALRNEPAYDVVEDWQQGEEVLVRAYDSKADPETFVSYANRITNRQAADRILSGWATRLRAAMDQTLRGASDD